MTTGLRQLLAGRKEEAWDEKNDDGLGESDEWGLDHLSELEEDDESENEGEGDPAAKEDDSEEEIERDGKAENILADADREEGSKVGQKKDADVDALADGLGKTGI